MEVMDFSRKTIEVKSHFHSSYQEYCAGKRKKGYKMNREALTKEETATEASVTSVSPVV